MSPVRFSSLRHLHGAQSQCVVRTPPAVEPDIRRESRFLPTPPAFDGPVRGHHRRNIAMTFGTEKLEWFGYPKTEKV